MPAQILSLPNMTLTSSMLNTSTATIAAVDVSDALAVSGFIAGTSTAPGYIIEVAFSSESTATFVPLMYQDTLVITSAATIVNFPYYLTSALAQWVPIAAKQARLATSAAHTSTGVTLNWVKQVHV